MAKKIVLRGPTESEIVRSVCEYLARRKHLYWRSNNVGIYDSARGVHRSLPFGSRKGVPDINVIDDTGHFIGLEVKKAGGRQSPEQKEFQLLCEKSGAEYHLIRSIDDVIEIGL